MSVLVAIVRVIAALAAGVALALSAVGFAAQQSVDEPQRFADSMAVSLQDPAVNAEIRTAIRTQVQDALERAGSDAGPLGTLAAEIGAGAVADKAADVVGTQAFENAWRDWSLFLFTGLADFAQGNPSPEVSVSGHTVTVQIEPLLAPVLGEALSDQVGQILDQLGQSSTVTLTTDVNLEPTLTAVGALARGRWPLLAIGVAALLIAVLPGRPRWAWLAGSLTWCCLVMAGTAALVGNSNALPRSPGDFPATGQAVLTAIVAGWNDVLVPGALILGGAALLAWLIAAVQGARRS